MQGEPWEGRGRVVAGPDFCLKGLSGCRVQKSCLGSRELSEEADGAVQVRSDGGSAWGQPGGSGGGEMGQFRMCCGGGAGTMPGAWVGRLRERKKWRMTPGYANILYAIP